MTYAQNRLIHDADFHLMEVDGCRIRGSIPPFATPFTHCPAIRKSSRRQAGPSRFGSSTMIPNFAPETQKTCCSEKITRPRRPFAAKIAPGRWIFLDLPASWCSPPSASATSGWTYGDDVELAYAAATAHNRMMTDFCSVDRRLLATGYVPLVDFGALRPAAKEAISLGAKALLDSLPLSRRAIRPAISASIRSGPGRGRRAANPLPRGRGGETNPGLFRKRPATGEGLPRRRGELHLGELHGHSRIGDADPGLPDHRRGDGPFPRLKFGAIELGASWFRAGCGSWTGGTLPSQERGTAAGCRPRQARSSSARCV